MAQFFNQALDSIKSTIEPLLLQAQYDNIDAENEIVSEMERLIASADENYKVIDGQITALKDFSGDKIAIKSTYLHSTHNMSLSCPSLEIDNVANTGVVGVMEVNNVNEAFKDIFWKEGEAVLIDNKALSTSGLTSNIDIMLNLNIINKVFLGRGKGQTLIRCSVPKVNGNISDAENLATMAINIYDAKRSFLKIEDDIDMNSHTVKVPNLSIGQSSISGIGVTSLLANGFQSLEAKEGIVSFRDRSDYLDRSLVISNESSISNAKTNFLSKIALVSYLEEELAPKTGWEAKNLSRQGSISSVELDHITQEVLAGGELSTSSSLNKKPITILEMTYILNKVGLELENIGGCHE